MYFYVWLCFVFTAVQAFSVVAMREAAPVAVLRLLIAVASLVASTGSGHEGLIS